MFGNRFGMKIERTVNWPYTGADDGSGPLGGRPKGLGGGPLGGRPRGGRALGGGALGAPCNTMLSVVELVTVGGGTRGGGPPLTIGCKVGGGPPAGCPRGGGCVIETELIGIPLGSGEPFILFLLLLLLLLLYLLLEVDKPPAADQCVFCLHSSFVVLLSWFSCPSVCLTDENLFCMHKTLLQESFQTFEGSSSNHRPAGKPCWN